MTDDPHPELRCRCVFRETYLPGLAHLLMASDYQDRCPQQATQEDGLCDHCRAGEGCPCCSPVGRGSTSGGCRWHGSNRRLVAAAQPCVGRPLDLTVNEGAL